jgi:hypothetical protein
MVRFFPKLDKTMNACLALLKNKRYELRLAAGECLVTVLSKKYDEATAGQVLLIFIKLVIDQSLVCNV